MTPDPRPDLEVERIIGDEVVRSPAAFTVSCDKLAWWALTDITKPDVVDTGILYYLLSICCCHCLFVLLFLLGGREFVLFLLRYFIFGAFSEATRGMVASGSRRDNVRVQIDLLHALRVCLLLAPVLFATDAMGVDDGSIDCGDFGVVACVPSPELLHWTLNVATRLGWTVASLDGDMSKLKDPAREQRKSHPFSRLPPELFEKPTCWYPLDLGRWKWVDHITFGPAPRYDSFRDWQQWVRRMPESWLTLQTIRLGRVQPPRAAALRML